MTKGEPYKWSDLALYNSEVDRGITHTPEWCAEMAKQQRQFDAEQEAEMRSQGFVPMAGGGWLKAGPRPSWWRRLLRL